MCRVGWGLTTVGDRPPPKPPSLQQPPLIQLYTNTKPSQTGAPHRAGPPPQPARAADAPLQVLPGLLHLANFGHLLG